MKKDDWKAMTEIEKKVIAMEREIKRNMYIRNLGDLAEASKTDSNERTVVPLITYNLETWTNIEEITWEELEKIQVKDDKEVLAKKDEATWSILH